MTSISKLLAFELGKANASATHKSAVEDHRTLETEFNPVDDASSSEEEVGEMQMSILKKQI